MTKVVEEFQKHFTENDMVKSKVKEFGGLKLASVVVNYTELYSNMRASRISLKRCSKLCKKDCVQ